VEGGEPEDGQQRVRNDGFEGTPDGSGPKYWTAAPNPRRVWAAVLTDLRECGFACLDREHAQSAVKTVIGKNSA
jgi:hypothetical protein